MQLTTFDWIIIGAYVFITLAVGIAFSRRAGKSLQEYFVSGRALPWWVAGTSMVATTFAADTPLAVTSIVIKDGLAGNWVWWAFATGGMITVFVYAKLWRRAGVVTDVELVELRYGGKPAAALRGIRAVYVALIVNSIIIGWVCGAMITFFDATIFAGGQLDEAARETRQWWLLIGCLLIVGIYCTLSGMWGVAITDMLQFVLAMVGCIFLAVIAVHHVGGVSELKSTVAAQFEDGEQAFRFIPSITGENAWMPLHAFGILLLVQWWATWYPGAEPGGGGYVVQRMASCKDENHSLWATLWYQVAHYCLRPWPWIMVAFVALAMFPELRANFLADSSSDPGVGYPQVITELAPAGLRGLMLVTFFAAFMSTISTQMNWGASYLVRDVYQRFIQTDGTDKHYARASRVASMIVLGCGGVVAWGMKDISIDTAWKILLALGAGTGAIFMLRWFWWRINAWSEISGMIASLVLFMLIGVKDKELLPTEVIHVDREETKILLVAVLSIVTWLVVTFLTRPESEKKLVAFYQQIRPGGCGWGPIAEKAGEVAVDRHLGLRFVAALIAAAGVYCILPGIGYLIFGEYLSAALCLGGAAICTGLVAWLMRYLVGNE